MTQVKAPTIIIKSDQEIGLMRRAGRIVAQVLAILAQQSAPGLKTARLDEVAEREVRRRGGVPSFKGYRGYPANLCVSINDEIVHGIPGERRLAEGDIVSLDLGVIYQGLQADGAVTVAVGDISPLARRLLAATQAALAAGIAAARPGVHLGDVSAAIQKVAEGQGFAVVREYVGHGIGRDMHEEPQVPNFGVPGRGPVLLKGMALALEPMVNTGGWRTRVASNHWTVLTADGGLSAHFEHTIALGESGAEVLTSLNVEDPAQGGRGGEG